MTWRYLQLDPIYYAENEISWCSFYVFSKIFGLLCLMTGLTCMVLLSSDSTHSHNIKGGLISKGIFNLVLMSNKMCNSVNSGQEIQRLKILHSWGTVLIQIYFSKGQLISKANFLVLIWTKNPTIFFLISALASKEFKSKNFVI